MTQEFINICDHDFHLLLLEGSTRLLFMIDILNLFLKQAALYAEMVYSLLAGSKVLQNDGFNVVDLLHKVIEFFVGFISLVLYFLHEGCKAGCPAGHVVKLPLGFVTALES